jgi:hypothetical protein
MIHGNYFFNNKVYMLLVETVRGAMMFENTYRNLLYETKLFGQNIGNEPEKVCPDFVTENEPKILSSILRY